MTGQPQILDLADIARRIPHQGNMCLLDSVTFWNDRQIICQAINHRDPEHPLRAHDRLGAACGIEYAAQAMAVHGALVAENLAVKNKGDRSAGNTPARAGYLVSLRSVTLNVERLDTIDGPLTVSTERMTGDVNTVLYSFKIQGGAQTLLSGRAVVVLDAAALPLAAPRSGCTV